MKNLTKIKWLPAKDAPGGIEALVKYKSGHLALAYKTDHGEPFMETWRSMAIGIRGEQIAWPDFYVSLVDIESLIE